MEPGSTIGLLFLAILLTLDALLSMAHAGLINANKTRLREQAEAGNKRAATAVKIAEDATRLLASHQLASTLIRFLTAAILTLTIAQAEVGWLLRMNVSPDLASWLAYGSVIIIGALVMVLFGEMIPASFAASRPNLIAIITARPFGIVMNLLSPVSRLLMWVSNRMAQAFGGKGDATYVTEEEIKTLVDAGSEEGVLETEEKEMIYSVIDFGDTIAREIMIPRIDIVALDADETTELALEVIIREGHSRIPIYEGSIDSIIGLLYAKDLLKLLRDVKGTVRKVRDLIRPAYFVPEAKKAGDLLSDLQQRKIHMAIVIDEYGGTAGLVTIEDLVEEIVGDIQDEYDPDEEAESQQISENEFLFDAGINLEEVNDLLDVELPTDESDTLGGYVFSVLGKVPLMGETFRVDHLELKVELITGRRIRKVRVKRIIPVSPAEQDKQDKQDRLDKLAEKADSIESAAVASDTAQPETPRPESTTVV